MVSTRGPNRQYFEKGEKVLCYEPDPTRISILYDSKILGTYEIKDKRGRKFTQYKVHFQGWSSSWDRKVNADFVLKDTAENRQLQRDLADKAQLHGSFLYRKERSSSSSSSKKRTRILNISQNLEDSCSGGSPANTEQNNLRPRGSSEDNFSSGSNFEKNASFSMRDECETESCNSSIESFHDEERVMLRISERLQQYLEYDHDMIVNYEKQHSLPARIPVVAILENFVKNSALKLVFSNTQNEIMRRRTTSQRTATQSKERDYDKLMTTVGLLKEVADGLRIYFDFTISDYLLYKQEKEYAMSYLSEESLKNFSYVATPVDLINTKCEQEQSILESMHNELQISFGASSVESHSVNDEPQKRKLRSSQRSDDGDQLLLENCFSSIASTSSGASTPLHSSMSASSVNYLKSLQPIAPQMREFLQAVLCWRLLPTNAIPAPSMIFGAAHLARLIVKLPEFLNASAINDDKLKVLLLHLDSFINYLEARKEWFNEDNYARTITKTITKVKNENNTFKSIDEQHEQLPKAETDQQHADIETAVSDTPTIATFCCIFIQ